MSTLFLGAEIQHFAQSTTAFFVQESGGAWTEAAKYALCATTGTLFELTRRLWAGFDAGPGDLQSGHDENRKPFIVIRAPNLDAVRQAELSSLRGFFSRWEVFNEGGDDYLLLSTTRACMEKLLPRGPLELSLLLHGLDSSVVL